VETAYDVIHFIVKRLATIGHASADEVTAAEKALGIEPAEAPAALTPAEEAQLADLKARQAAAAGAAAPQPAPSVTPEG
jgi:hypothetical protein